MSSNAKNDSAEGEQKKSNKNLNLSNPSEPTKNLKVDLTPLQQSTLTWMLHREDQKVSGGILVDDIGVDKTLSVISLIVKSQEQNKNSDDTFAGTLIITPPSLINQWKNEIENTTKEGFLTVEVYHGKQRNKNPAILAQKNIVITTYGIIVKEVKKLPLFSLTWRRVVLDGANQIKNYKSKTAEAVFELSSKSRWAMMELPSNISDMYSFFKFLQYAPYDDLQEWKSLVNDSYQLAKVRSKIISSELEEKTFIQTLPQKNMKIIEIKLNKEEKEIYDYVIEISSRGRAIYFGEPNSKKTKEIKHYHVLVIVLLLRQICCHPHLIVKKLQKRDDDDYIPSKYQRSKIDVLKDFEKINDGKSDQSDLNFSKPIFKIQNPSTKIEHLLKLLKKITSKKEKAVVVSQWTSFLDLIAVHVSKANISSVCLTGKKTNSERTTIVDNFNDPDSDTRVLLLSLTAGGVGLNLVGANHLFLMDLHWNPQLENQAQDRIYRIGQNKPVYIYKFLTVGTIEERIKDLQDRKLNIADSMLETNEKKLCKELLEIILCGSEKKLS